MRFFVLSLAAFVACLYVVWSGSPALSEEENRVPRDELICREREEQLYSIRHGSPEFGVEVLSGTERGFHYATFITRFEFKKRGFDSSSYNPNQRRIPAVANLSECTEFNEFPYSDDPTLCIVPRVPEVKKTEAWHELIEQNSLKTRFRAICPHRYSETEKSLFLFDQKNFQEGRNEVVLWDYIGRQIYDDAYEACVAEARSTQDYLQIKRERQAVLDSTDGCRKAAKIFGVEISGEYDFSECEGKIVFPDDPIFEVRKSCEQLVTSANSDYLHAFEMYKRMRANQD